MHTVNHLRPPLIWRDASSTPGDVGLLTTRAPTTPSMHEPERDAMSTRTEQQYIVHLDIHATAPDPSYAVREALEEVRIGELGNLAYSVEEVGDGAEVVPIPTPHRDSAQAMDRTWRAESRTKHNRYPNEFLG